MFFPEIKGPCFCCEPFALLVLTVIATLVISLSSLFTLKKTKNVVFKSICITIVISGMLLAIITAHPDLKRFIFSRVFILIYNSKSSNVMDRLVRCPLLAKVTGKVLEIGPGPGSNFRCLYKNLISEWVGIEPNGYFKEAQEQEIRRYNISFPTRTVHSENMTSIESDSFDYVIATHVLCSVNKPSQLLNQIARVLKPNGGVYVFLEHVSAQYGWTRFSQTLFAPLFDALGGGCAFKNTFDDIAMLATPDSHNELKGKFKVDLEYFEAPVPIYLLVPHIRGNVTRTA